MVSLVRSGVWKRGSGGISSSRRGTSVARARTSQPGRCLGPWWEGHLWSACWATHTPGLKWYHDALYASFSLAVRKHCSLSQNINAGEECCEVESHDESDGSEGVEILAVGQDDARGGDHDVGHEEGGVSSIVVRCPTINEAACGQRGRIVLIVLKFFSTNLLPIAAPTKKMDCVKGPFHDSWQTQFIYKTIRFSRIYQH